MELLPVARQHLPCVHISSLGCLLVLLGRCVATIQGLVQILEVRGFGQIEENSQSHWDV